jgi:hypothetical protein
MIAHICAMNNVVFTDHGSFSFPELLTRPEQNRIAVEGRAKSRMRGAWLVA